jgi:hypothetical protein
MEVFHTGLFSAIRIVTKMNAMAALEGGGGVVKDGLGTVYCNKDSSVLWKLQMMSFSWIGKLSISV